MNSFLLTLQGYASDYLVDILIAIVVLIIGLWVIKRIVKLVQKLLDKSTMDATLKPFLASVTSIALKVMLIIGVIGMAGYETTSFIAVLGASSLAIGLAFQGALSNLAGGVLLLALRPFKVGDYIEVAGQTGIVEAIHIFNTILISLDNKVISVPNGAVAGATTINYTEKDKRRVDLVFGVGYDSDLRQVAKIIETVSKSHPMVDKDPAPFVRLGNQGASSLDFTVRLWCDTANYWDVYFDIMEQVTDAFNQNNISIPFPQMDVHLDK